MAGKKHARDLRKQHLKRAAARKAEEASRLADSVGRREFGRSYVDEYRRVSETAVLDHDSLVGVFECSDELYFDLEVGDKLEHFGLGQYRQVILKIAGDLDFDSDHTAVDGKVNARRERPVGTYIAGETCIIVDDVERKTVVFMRASSGGGEAAEKAAAVKLPALLHELGHVSDIEASINFRGNEIDLVAAEVYAHEFACRAMIEGRHLSSLRVYLDGITKLANSPSEYMKTAAARFIDSPNWPRYKAAVAPSIDL